MNRRSFLAALIAAPVAPKAAAAIPVKRYQTVEFGLGFTTNTNLLGPGANLTFESLKAAYDELRAEEEAFVSSVWMGDRRTLKTSPARSDQPQGT